MGLAEGVLVGAGALLAVYALERLVLTLVALGARDPAAPAPPAGSGAAGAAEVPFVTVQLPLYNEPAVAARLVDAAAGLAWPRARLELQVLDDSDDETTAIVAARVAAWRAAGVDVVHVRRPARTGFKAGALAHGLASARGELVLVLDADFVPAPDLLARAVPHFADARVAVVQLGWAHLNRDARWLTRAQALLLDGHFQVEQRARAAAGWFFNFNGTAGLWRRAAIAGAGGWSADTLTEDLDLSYRALLAGWRFVYLGDASVPAELPDSVRAFQGQQHRWAKGALQCARKLLPAVWRARLPLATKLEATLHLTSNAAYPLTLLLVAASAALAFGPREAAPATGAIAAWGLLPAAIYVGYYVVAQRGERLWRRLARLPIAVTLGLGMIVSQTRAVLAGLAGPVGEFVRTPKTGAAGAKRPAPPRARGRLGDRLLAAGAAAATVAAVANGHVALVPLLGATALGAGYLGWADARG